MTGDVIDGENIYHVARCPHYRPQRKERADVNHNSNNTRTTSNKAQDRGTSSSGQNGEYSIAGTARTCYFQFVGDSQWSVVC